MSFAGPEHLYTLRQARFLLEHYECERGRHFPVPPEVGSTSADPERKDWLYCQCGQKAYEPHDMGWELPPR
jgi:hypothetical protein